MLEEAHIVPNPRGFIIAEKSSEILKGVESSSRRSWVDPMFKQQLHAVEGGVVNKSMGITYPLLQGVPILKKQFGIFSNALT